MLRPEGFDAVEDEEELEIHRLFGPERAVVVEGAMRSAGGTKSTEPSVVTFPTMATIDIFAAPSFQEGNGPAA